MQLQCSTAYENTVRTQSNCECIRVWAMYVLWYGRGSAIVRTCTLQRALQLTFEFIMPTSGKHGAKGLCAWLPNNGVCIVHVEKYITQNGDSLNVSWGFPACVMGIPCMCHRASQWVPVSWLCMQTRPVIVTYWTGVLILSTVLSAPVLFDLSVQYSPFSLVVHMYVFYYY